ncbi:hypothetical protein SBOR_8857 [Sclerotinia borealis F-4128]|uniref:Uncharacterized protein n=1 Tax=Sclerotinia borealis (strain F-4128) TaxID=1432307 RepID=W9C1S2_SCLBF|nr:hypothetical protein SBOR_8857 [Sclerotinia borealis F-4128]
MPGMWQRTEQPYKPQRLVAMQHDRRNKKTLYLTPQITYCSNVPLALRHHKHPGMRRLSPVFAAERDESARDEPGTEDYQRNGDENHPTMEATIDKFKAVPALTSLSWEAEPDGVLTRRAQRRYTGLRLLSDSNPINFKFPLRLFYTTTNYTLGGKGYEDVLVSGLETLRLRCLVKGMSALERTDARVGLQ